VTRALALTFALVATACAGRPPAGVHGGPALADAAAETDAGALDSGAARECTHDGKDATPCAEECDRGIASSCAELASRVERARDLPRAVALHERACELRDAASCVAAARMHAAGAGVPPSRARQVELLGAACRLGDGFACAIPAKAYATGAGVPANEGRAIELWQHACGAGVESACEAVTDAGAPPP
jgi:hypothetical protein